MRLFSGRILGRSNSPKSTATIAVTTDENEDEENNVGSSLIMWSILGQSLVELHTYGTYCQRESF